MSTKAIIGIALVVPFAGILLWVLGSFARDAIRRRDATFFIALLAGVTAGVGVSLLLESLLQ